MMINAFMPPIEFGIAWGMKIAYRYLDRGFSQDTYKTKKKSISQYVALYSGSDYMIHYRYSSLMNTCFVTLIYGTAMPILYPIALIAFIVAFVNDKLLVFYFYKQPPAFDAKMTQMTYGMLTWTPIWFLAFSYWFLSNNQIFDNKVYPIAYLTDV